MAWMLTALLLAPLSQIPQAFSTMGASVRDLLFAPVLMLQYAVQFIQLAVPSSAATGGPRGPVLPASRG